MEDEIRDRHAGDQEQRAPVAHQQDERARSRERQHHGGEWNRIPGVHERVNQGERDQPRRRIRVEHLAAGEVLARLGAQRGQVGLQPATGHQQRHRPGQCADGEGHGRAHDGAGHAAADAIDQHDGEQRGGEPERLRAQPHGKSGDQRAQHDHLARLGQSVGHHPAIAVGLRGLPPPRGEQARLGGQRQRQARQVAHRTDGERPHERSGERQERRAQGGRIPRLPGLCAVAHGGGRGEDPEQQERRDHRGRQRDERQRPRFDSGRLGAGRQRADHGGHGFAERDVDGIAGGMGAMLRDIEVADAQREVHRVDVFEGCRDERQVGEANGQGERGDRARRRHETGRKRSASFRLPRR